MSDTDHDLLVRIASDHDLLVRLDERFDYMEKAHKLSTETDAVHDKRLRVIEEKHSMIMVYVLLVGGVAGTIVHGAITLFGKYWRW